MSTRQPQSTPDPRRIEPFWSRLPAIALYPMHSSALLTIFVLALCRLSIYLPMGWLLHLLVWIPFYKYAAECLRASANGVLTPPEFATRVDESSGWTIVKLQIVYVILVLVATIFLGPIAGAATMIVLGIGLPAMTMSIAMDGSLGHALNPATWLSVIARIGGPYLLLMGLTLLFNISESRVMALLPPYLPGPLAVVVYYMIAQYVALMTFHLMGYMIWQYHSELGFEPEIETVAPLAARRDDPDGELLEQSQALVREGEVDAAIAVLREHIRSRGGTPSVHTQYRKLLALGDHREESLRHGREWLDILIGQDDNRRALALLRECVALDPAFKPPADTVLRLATLASEASQTQLALSLLSGFHRTNPKHKDLPANYLLAARLLAERMGRDAEARKLLDHLLGAFPQHALREDIARYRAFLDTLAAPAPARAPNG